MRRRYHKNSTDRDNHDQRSRPRDKAQSRRVAFCTDGFSSANIIFVSQYIQVEIQIRVDFPPPIIWYLEYFMVC